MIEELNKIAVFRSQKIRRIIYKNEWWFSIIDVIEALIQTDRSRKYWNDLKTKLTKEGYHEMSEKIGQLKLEAPDGKLRETDCANTETLFRIVQSIPSPKAEPFKRWLAQKKAGVLYILNRCHAEFISASLANASNYLKQVERFRNKFGMTTPQYLFISKDESWIL